MFLQAIIKPWEIFVSEKNNANYFKIFKNMAIAFILYYLFYLIFKVIPNYELSLKLYPSRDPSILAVLFNSLGAIILFAILLVFFFSVLFIAFLISKILKGRGSFKQLFYLISIVGPLLAIVAYFFWPLSILIFLYFLTVAVKESQGFSLIKSIIISILSVTLGFMPIILIIISFVLGAGGLGAGMRF